jgi:hypothetical protein
MCRNERLRVFMEVQQDPQLPQISVVVPTNSDNPACLQILRGQTGIASSHYQTYGQSARSEASQGKESWTINVRRLVLDVDTAIARPALIDLAEAIEHVAGVEGLNITVTEIDIETVGMNITIEGEHLDYAALVETIESTGTGAHSID